MEVRVRDEYGGRRAPCISRTTVCRSARQRTIGTEAAGEPARVGAPLSDPPLRFESGNDSFSLLYVQRQMVKRKRLSGPLLTLGVPQEQPSGLGCRSAGRAMMRQREVPRPGAIRDLTAATSRRAHRRGGR